MNLLKLAQGASGDINANISDLLRGLPIENSVSGSAATVGGFLLILFAIIVFFAALIGYLLSAIGLSKIAKKKAEENTWLSWVPLLKDYLSCKIAFNNKTYALIYLIFLCVMSALSIFSMRITAQNVINMNFNLSTFGIAATIFSFVIDYKIYKQFSRKATLMLVFDILTLRLLNPVFLFAIGNNELQTQESQT